MKSSFLPKYKQKIVKISALIAQGRNPYNFLGETMTSKIHSEINWTSKTYKRSIKDYLLNYTTIFDLSKVSLKNS